MTWATAGQMPLAVAVVFSYLANTYGAFGALNPVAEQHEAAVQREITRMNQTG